jgi:AAA15 family ATPase/GTPase
MLIQFSVENFRSFKTKAILSLAPSKEVSHENNVSLLENGERILNTIAIYGANAAGKTNLFKALTTAILMIRRSNQIQKNEKLDGIVPFLFDEVNQVAPTSFEFIFVAKGVKYIYGFSANQSEITEEYLYAYYSAKPSTIFERQAGQFYFPKDKRMLDQVAEKNTPNKLFLSTATTWNYLRTEDAFNWFSENINTYPEYENLHMIAFEQFTKDEENQFHKFALDLLKESDLNIDEFLIQSEQMSDEEFAQLFGPLFVVMNEGKKLEGQKRHVIMDHVFRYEDGTTKTFKLNLLDESKGTANIFLLAPIIKRALMTGETVIIDEIERSLHPLLVKHIIGYFNDPEINNKHAQLIFNTHNLELMSLDLFRRDQIYFVDKSTKNGSSELYSLDEFSVRTEENVKKGYLLGRFGAIPSVVEGQA